MSLTNRRDYDIIIIGSGISCTATMIELLDKLDNGAHQVNPLHIAVIEKDKECWKGVPYGNKSSINSLTITNLGEFVPVAEKEQFVHWLAKNQLQWMNELKQKGGATASVWLENNIWPVSNEDLDKIYIPRYLFGQYLEEKIKAKIEIAEKNKTIIVSYIRGLAIDVSKNNKRGYQVKIKDKDGGDILAQGDKIILCIGSPPVKYISNLNGQANYTYINDTYHPSLTDNLETIESALSSVENKEDRNILILGSNASSLELVYLISSHIPLRNSINRIIVLSGSGALPRRINDNHATKYEFGNMVFLKNQGIFTSQELMLAIEKDMALAELNGVNMADVHNPLSDLIVELLGKLGYTEKEKFHCLHGADFSKIIRRAGAEYSDAATSLEKSGKLNILKGILSGLKGTGDSGKVASAMYRTDKGKDEIVFPLSFSVIVNCGGFEALDSSSSSELISNLIVRKLCKVNCTGRGFIVNDRFEAGDGLYIMGPLLGGIFNEKAKLWHVENAKSIFHLANLMVSEMKGDLYKYYKPVLQKNTVTTA